MKGYLPLVTLCFYLFSSASLTAVGNKTYSDESVFNASLRSSGSKSTLRDFNGITTVVIDAGHGGTDPGGLGKFCQEKHIALSVAKLLEQGITDNFPEIEVIMTRSKDNFIPLIERAKLANEEGADLFISIHANIDPKGSANGTETFVMGNSSNAYNLMVAKRENSSYGLLEDGSYLNNHELGSDAFHIIANAAQSDNMNKSIKLAGLIESAFSGTGRNSRGVKQANFLVLKATTMPSVLVELGFLSDRTEEAYLMSKSGQSELASSLFEAFVQYHEAIGGTPSVRRPKLNFSESASGPVTADIPDRKGQAPPYKRSDEGLPATGNPPTAASAPLAVNGPTNIGLQLAALSSRADVAAQGWNKYGKPVAETYQGGHYKYTLKDFESVEQARRMQARLTADGLSSTLVAYQGSKRLLGEEFKRAIAAR